MDTKPTSRLLISRTTQRIFRDFMKGNLTLKEIEEAFDDVGIKSDKSYNPSLTSQRATLVEQYYTTADFSNWRDVRRVLKVYEMVLLKLPDDWQKMREHLTKYLERDGFVWKEGHLVPVHGVPAVTQLRDVVSRFDDDYLLRQIDRMHESIEQDPWLAIGTAKELVESCCKTILDDRGITYTADADIGELTKAALKTLKLSASDIPNDAKASKTIKTLLNNLGTITKGLAEMRNAYGTGHGKPKSAKGLQPRHAKLACGAAATFAIFLYETHKERPPF